MNNDSSRQEISLRFGPLLNSKYPITKILEENVVSFPHAHHTILLLLLLLRGPIMSSNIMMLFSEQQMGREDKDR